MPAHPPGSRSNTSTTIQASTALPPPEQPAGTEQPAELDTIRVSASHIDRPDFVSPTPILPVSAEELKLDMRPNVGAALNDLPQFRATSSPQTSGTSRATGNSPVDLRGLGSSRTLVLLDRHRLSGDNDLNSIPSVLVKYVDVVTGGASAAWGSGAVGGVVNITLDHDFTGVKLGAQGGESVYSDGRERRIEAAWGADLAGGRGHVLVGGEFLDHDGVIPRSARASTRRWAVLSIDGARTLMPDIGYADAAVGGLIVGARDANGNRLADFPLTGQAFNPDGSLRNFEYGRVSGSLMSGGDGPHIDDSGPLIAPIKRYSTLASTRFDLGANARMSADLRHSRMYNNHILFTDNNRGNSATGAIPIRLDNAFLPEAVRLQMLDAQADTLVLGRYNHDINHPRMDYERKTTQGTLAFDGEMGEHWRWSTYYSHGQAELNFDLPGFVLTQEWANAVDSVIHPITGQPVCRIALTDPDSHCVPLNVFGEGSPSQAAADYVTGTVMEHTTLKLDTFGFSLRGEPFSLPHGPVSVATGLEARRESVDRRTDERSIRKEYRFINYDPMQGHFTLKEAFAEVLLPISKDRPGAHDFSINAAARISDYSVTGNIWSWKIGATNAFFPGFRGRFTRSRDIRAADLYERFTTSSTFYIDVFDPVTNRTFLAPTIGGGNPGLRPEIAKTLTLGMTWTPQSIPGLDISVDYFDIEINDVISAIGLQDILNRCADGNQLMCARVERDANNEIIRAVSTFANLSQHATDGVDIEIAWRGAANMFGIPGRVNVRALGTWVHSLSTDDGIVKLEYVTSQNVASSLGVPKWRAIGSIGFDSTRFSANFRTRYISAGHYDRNQAIINGAIGSYFYHDLGASAKFSGGQVEVYTTIHNLANKKAPINSTFSPTYDVLGRYTSVGIRMNF